jgi:hypothetical protein
MTRNDVTGLQVFGLGVDGNDITKIYTQLHQVGQVVAL